MKYALVVGCGISGAVIARELAENGYMVRILEKRNHIGGNMYDFVDEHGILVHKYGPHTFHTKKKELYDYICKYGEWDEYHLTCGAEINGICTPTPFNYQTIDDFYSQEKARIIKDEIKKAFPGQETAPVVEALNCSNKHVREYAQFLFDNDYRLYSAKQWGVPPEEIDPSILKRVPLRFNYDEGYFDDAYQVMPHDGYTSFFKRLLAHENISLELGINALEHIKILDEKLYMDGDEVNFPLIYTGALDELFQYCYGKLPYRGVRSEWKYELKDSLQKYAVVAYPQEKEIVRIIEYKKLPAQNVQGTAYEVEYSIPYTVSGGGYHCEPCYPVLTDISQRDYLQYRMMANKIANFYLCGRLADFKYYNMDQALEAALKVAKAIQGN